MTKIEFATDRVPLWGTVLVGIATTAYLGASITPDLWSQVVMGIFAGALPLISVRFLIKKKFRFFWLTVGLIVFSDVSMVLALTEGQALTVEAVVSSEDQTPPALKRLQNASDKAQKTLDDLVEQQRDAKARQTLDNIDGQITEARKALSEAQRFEREWKPVEKSDEGRVSSRNVFMAIPRALISLELDRYLTTLYALIIAIVYQGTVIASAQATVKQVKAGELKTTGPKRRKRRAKTATPPGETPPPEPESLAEVEETEQEGIARTQE